MTDILTGETGILRKDRDYAEPGRTQYEIDQRWMAKWVGVTAVALPLFMYASTFFGVCFYYSISHFYFSSFPGAVFVAALAFVGTFLMAYRDRNSTLTTLATFAGIAAFLIAVFPTSHDGCAVIGEAFNGRAFGAFVKGAAGADPAYAPASAPSFLMTPWSPYIHYAAAVFVFGFLTFYCWFVFTARDDDRYYDDKGRLQPSKTYRNGIYVACGLVMLAAMVAMAAYYVAGWPWWNELRLTFVCEAAALIAFGVAWLLKGRAVPKLLLDEADR